MDGKIAYAKKKILHKINQPVIVNRNTSRHIN